MLTRSVPMSRGTATLTRTGFKTRGAAHAERGAAHPAAERQEGRAERLAERARRAMESAAFSEQLKALQDRVKGRADKAPAAIFSGLIAAETPTSCPKEQPLRSEAYRRLVAAMPCKGCGIVSRSQHAHENLGKGRGLKVDDRRGFPLCTVAPGRIGCHELFDQYQLVEGGREAHRALGAQWAAETRQQIEDSGQWPARLPKWTEEAK